MKHAYIFILIFATFILTGCPDDNPVKPDPCAGKKPVSASFKIYEVVTQIMPAGIWEFYDTDTCATNTLLFVADDSTANSYEWHLGSEILKTRSFSRTDFPKQELIPVTLILHKTPDSLCFPNDDGTDTITRYFYKIGNDSIGHREKDFISGNYFGFNTDDTTNKYTINIDNFYLPPGKPDVNYNRTLRMINLSPNTDIFLWRDAFASYKELYFRNDYTSETSLTPKGIALISGKNNDSITIKYSIQKLPGHSNYDNRVNKIFKGVRVK